MDRLRVCERSTPLEDSTHDGARTCKALMHVEEKLATLGLRLPEPFAAAGSTRATPMTSTAVLRTYPIPCNLDRPSLALRATTTLRMQPATIVKPNNALDERHHGDAHDEHAALRTYPIARNPDRLSGALRELSVGDVDEMRDRSGWLEFSRPALELRFLYPAVTPRGRPVEVEEEERDGAHRVHLSAEGGEVYVELFRFPDLEPAEEDARHREYLASASPRRRQRSEGDDLAEVAGMILRVSRERDRACGAVASGGPGHVPDHLRPASAVDGRDHRDGAHQGNSPFRGY